MIFAKKKNEMLSLFIVFLCRFTNDKTITYLQFYTTKKNR